MTIPIIRISLIIELDIQRCVCFCLYLSISCKSLDQLDSDLKENTVLMQIRFYLDGMTQWRIIQGGGNAPKY